MKPLATQVNLGVITEKLTEIMASFMLEKFPK